MTDETKGGPPSWVFTILMVCGFLVCGLYLGMMRAEGASTGHFVRAVGFGVLGLLMLWGALRRHRGSPGR